MAAEVPPKVEAGVKSRVDATRDAVKREVDIVRTFVRDVAGLKPVKAVIDLGVDTLDNVGDWVKRQAEITRKWVS
jgi:hypothetical protein